MKLVAVVRTPERAEEAAQALAEAAGVAPAEARLRLAPEPPALLARLEPSRADALAASLRKAGVAVLALDAAVPKDEHRTVARTVSFDADGFTFTPRGGNPVGIPSGEVLGILRASRSSRVDTERTEKSRELSWTRSLSTGVPMTRTVTKTVHASDEQVEQVVFVLARDGREVALAEREVDFSCLGPGMQPSSTANMAELARRLREGARAAFYDERLLRLGRRPLPFLGGGEWRSQTPTATTVRTDTAGSLDVLLEAMRQALLAGLLP